MICYKISFLIVWISVVCFSADVNPDENQRLENIENCKTAMDSTFGKNRKPLACIQKAIMDMKLFGEHPFKYHDDVIFYYQSFHMGVKLGSVILPKKHCRKDKECYKQLRIFEEPPNIERELPVFDDEEINIIEMATRNAKPLEGPSSSGSSTVGATRSAKQLQENTLRTNILRNALYYHVIIYQKYGFTIPEDDTKVYFHQSGTYGFEFLVDISRHIVFKKGSLANPYEFCEERYPEPESEANSQNRANFQSQANTQNQENFQSQANYQNQENFQSQANYQNQENFQSQANYQNQENFQSQANYQNQENFQSQANYQNKENFQSQENYQNQENFQSQKNPQYLAEDEDDEDEDDDDVTAYLNFD